MKKFIILYQASPDSWNPSEQSTEEDMKKGMEGWMIWAEKCGEHLLDMGNPLGNALKILPGGKSEQSSGETLGYSILQAKDMDHARELMKDHPHLDWNATCQITVHETMPTPGAE